MKKLKINLYTNFKLKFLEGSKKILKLLNKRGYITILKTVKTVGVLLQKNIV